MFAVTTLTELSTVLVAVIAALGGLLFGFYKFATDQMKEARKERAEERKEFSKVLDRVADSSAAVAAATTRSADEAKQRNGHLAELVTASNAKLMEGLREIKNQKVSEQIVEHQTVEHLDNQGGSA